MDISLYQLTNFIFGTEDGYGLVFGDNEVLSIGCEADDYDIIEIPVAQIRGMPSDDEVDCVGNGTDDDPFIIGYSAQGKIVDDEKTINKYGLKTKFITASSEPVVDPSITGGVLERLNEPEPMYKNAPAESFWVPYEFERWTGVQTVYQNRVISSSGSNSGRIIRVETPYAYNGYSYGQIYKPFTANGALIDPASEPGDAFFMLGFSSMIVNMTLNFGPNAKADISAPKSEDVDSWYPQKSSAKKAADESRIQSTSFTQQTKQRFSIVTELPEDYEKHPDMLYVLLKNPDDSGEFD